MTTENRKKIQFYIYPEQKPQEEIAVQHYEALPTALRASAYRNAMVAGVALAAIDPRLPEILAVSLSTSPSKEELARIIAGFIGASCGESLAELAEQPETPAAEVSPVSVQEPVPVPEPKPEPKANPLSEDDLSSLTSNFAQ